MIYILVVLLQCLASTKRGVGDAIPRVTVKEEKTILEETSQIVTSSPVCSHNEWDPLEVIVGDYCAKNTARFVV